MQSLGTLNRQAEFEDELPLLAGNLKVDPAGRRACIKDKSLPLTQQEFDLLMLLMRTPDSVVSRRRICETLWGREGRVEKKRLPVVMSHLRLKLIEARPYAIETVRGRGYGLLRQRA